MSPGKCGLYVSVLSLNGLVEKEREKKERWDAELLSGDVDREEK